MVAPVILAVIASIAGHPATVACDAATNPPPDQRPAGFITRAWTLYGGNVIHAIPEYCDGTTAPIDSNAFALSLEIFIHEAAHARGIRNESCAEMTADIGVYDILRRFYGIPFFSPRSIAIGAEVLAFTRTLNDDYQPELCWNSGSYG